MRTEVSPGSDHAGRFRGTRSRPGRGDPEPSIDDLGDDRVVAASSGRTRSQTTERARPMAPYGGSRAWRRRTSGRAWFNGIRAASASRAQGHTRTIASHGLMRRVSRSAGGLVPGEVRRPQGGGGVWATAAGAADRRGGDRVRRRRCRGRPAPVRRALRHGWSGHAVPSAVLGQPQRRGQFSTRPSVRRDGTSSSSRQRSRLRHRGTAPLTTR